MTVVDGALKKKKAKNEWNTDSWANVIDVGEAVESEKGA